MHKGMKEQQTCQVFIEVFKPGLGNGFQQRYTYIVMLMFLNLAIVHSSSDVSVRTMMTIVQEITFAFQYSSKMDKFEQELWRNDAVKCKLDGKSKLKTL